MKTYDLVNDEPLCILPDMWEEIWLEISKCDEPIWWYEDLGCWLAEDFIVPLAFLLMLSKAHLIEPSQAYGVRMWCKAVNNGC